MLAGFIVLAAAGGEAASGGLPQLQPDVFAPQLIWLVITFSALFYIMAKIALPRISSVIEERRQRIQRDLDEAERLKTETDQALQEYETALAEARTRANRIASEKRDALKRDVEEKRNDVDQKIASQLANAEQRIAATKTNALANVNEIAVETAQSIVSRLIGKDVTPEAAAKALTENGEQK